MAYIGGHIQGHSGTDFKHRKAFVKRKENLKNTERTTDVHTVPREKEPIFTLFTPIKFTISILLFALLVLAIVFSLEKIDTTLSNTFSPPTHIQKEKKQREMQNANHVLYNSARLHYNAGNYDIA